MSERLPPSGEGPAPGAPGAPGGAEAATALLPAPPSSSGARAFAAGVDRVILALARHWILTVNLLVGLFAGLPLLGPWLRARGYTLPANLIYGFYRLTCHQMPERSFFAFGHQVCYCQRCMAIYSGFFLLGLAYPLLRRIGRPRPLRWRWMFLLWVPMALDGFTQLFGLRESTWQLRVITGGLFALSCFWVAFPHLEQAFGEMRDQLERRFAWSEGGAA